MRTIVLGLLYLVLVVWPRPVFAGPALLFDAADGKILYAENIDALWHPAGLVQLMTAYLSFEAIANGRLKLTDKVVASANAARQAPTKLGLPVGAELSVSLALLAIIVKSASDVSVMLAEKIAPSVGHFVLQMNLKARALGMTRTIFVNPHGLPDLRHVTTARDMGILARALIRDFPQFAYVFNATGMKLGNRTLQAHVHRGLGDIVEGLDGMKTGFNCRPGYHVVASATRNGHRLVAVVLGARTGRSSYSRAQELLEHGFKSMQSRKMFDTGTLETRPIEPSLSQAPPNVKVCRRPTKRKKKRTRKRQTN